MGFFRIDIKKAKLRPPNKLERLSAKMAGQISISLFSGIKKLKSRVSSEKLNEAITSGSIGHIVKEIGWDKAIEDILPSYQKFGDSFEQAGMISFNALPPPIKNNLRIDLKNPLLKKFINDRFNKFMQDLSTESSNIVQRSIQRSFSHALAPSQVAKEIMGHIGLNDRQSMALSNYRSGLEKTKTRPENIERYTELYSNRLLKQRSIMIARTEIQNANNQGQLAVWKQGQDEGLLNAEETYKVWENDVNPCPICRQMHGKKVKLNERWILPDGKTVNVPSEIHPNCFCFQTLEI
jgi:hypothetical protein